MFALVLAIVLAAAGFVLLRLKDHPESSCRYAAIPFGLASVPRRAAPRTTASTRARPR